jgi:hypothetical protein
MTIIVIFTGLLARVRVLGGGGRRGRRRRGTIRGLVRASLQLDEAVTFWKY